MLLGIFFYLYQKARINHLFFTDLSFTELQLQLLWHPFYCICSKVSDTAAALMACRGTRMKPNCWLYSFILVSLLKIGLLRLYYDTAAFFLYVLTYSMQYAIYPYIHA